MTDWMEIAKEMGFDAAAPIAPKALTAREDVRDMCAADKCGAYRKNWICPPGLWYGGNHHGKHPLSQEFYGLCVRKQHGTGGSELLKYKINEMGEESFAQYLRFHYYTCEKPEHLGASNHLLFVEEKN